MNARGIRASLNVSCIDGAFVDYAVCYWRGGNVSGGWGRSRDVSSGGHGRGADVGSGRDRRRMVHISSRGHGRCYISRRHRWRRYVSRGHGGRSHYGRCGRVVHDHRRRRLMVYNLGWWGWGVIDVNLGGRNRLPHRVLWTLLVVVLALLILLLILRLLILLLVLRLLVLLLVLRLLILLLLLVLLLVILIVL